MSIVLAYSGGLDTSFCVPYLKETYGQTVITVTVNTGGIRPEDEQQLQERSRELGAEKHVTIDGRSRLFDTVLSYLIKGNVRRGLRHPLGSDTERSEEHTSELQSRGHLVCRLLLEKKKQKATVHT